MEKSYVFDSAEIESVIYDCVTCKQQVSVKVASEKMPPFGCPGCGAHLFPMTIETRQDPRVAILKNLRELSSDTSLRLLVSDPDVRLTPSVLTGRYVFAATQVHSVKGCFECDDLFTLSSSFHSYWG